MAPGADTALVGRRIAGKFLVEKHLGDGAMGAVYRARDTILDRLVALKVMHPQMAVDPSFAGRFHREAKAASRLDHPSSLRVIEFGEDPDGLLFIAMEYLEGRDLYQVMHEDWPLPEERIADIVMKALSALTMAHEMGVIHRDLKPENIMILDRKDDEGHDLVKVCDFGIAKITGPDEETGETKAAGHLVTTTGLVVGTPEYMSPEQARGERLDARSDLYAMGIILYQLLTGRTPFVGDTALGVVLKHISELPEPPSTIYPEVHKGLAEVCLKALAKPRDARFQSAREFRSAIKLAMGRPLGLASDIPQPLLREEPSSDGAMAIAATLRRSEPPPGLRSEPPGVSRTQKLPSVAPQGLAAPPSVAPPASAAPPPSVAPPSVAPPAVPIGSSLASPEERRARWPLVVGALVVLATVGALLFVLFVAGPQRTAPSAPSPTGSVSAEPSAAPAGSYLRRGGGSRSSAR